MKTIIANLFFILLFLIVKTPSYGSHASGGELAYKCLGNDSAGNSIFQIELKLFRDCSGINAPANALVDVSSISCGISGITLNLALTGPALQVSNICASQIPNSSCNGGALPGIEQYTYTGIVTLPAACPDWIVSFSECCRSNAITNLANASSFNLFVYATINNVGICNNSPVFAPPSGLVMASGKSVSLSFGATDPDGDSLAFFIKNPLDASTPIPYTFPFSTTLPFNVTGPFVFDSCTGTMSFTPNVPQTPVLAVCINEYRNGVLIGTVMRDIILIVVNWIANNPPALTGGGVQNVSGGILLDSFKLSASAGVPLSFSLSASDPDTSNIITVANHHPAISVSTSGTNPITFTFNWTPTQADTGTVLLNFSIMDDDCPILGVNSYAIKIIMDRATDAGAGGTYCQSSGPVQLGATGGTVFSWSPSAGLSNPNIPNPLAAPLVTTTYYVTSNLLVSNTDSVTVMVNSNSVPANAGNDLYICDGNNTQLNGSGGVSYSWSPDTYLNNAALPNPSLTPDASISYVLTAVDSTGCTGKDSVTINLSQLEPTISKADETCNYNDGSAAFSGTGNFLPVDILWSTGDTTTIITGLAPEDYWLQATDSLGCLAVDSFTVSPYILAKAVATSDTLCKGDTVQLFLRVNGFSGSCGINGSNCVTALQNVIVGTGTSGTGNGTPFDGFWEDGRVQYLFRTSELLNAGMTAGTIGNLAWFVTSKESTAPYLGFTVKLGCTNLSALSPTAFSTSPMNVVFGPTSYSTMAGWNSIPLYNAYDWDGFSNLIVEVCFNNSSYTGDDDVSFSSTAYTSVVYDYTDGAIGCNLSTSTGSTSRPNIMFSQCQTEAQNITNVIWTPSIGLSDSTSINPLGFPSSTTTYYVNMQDSLGCITSDSITLYVNYIDVQLPDDTTLCGTNLLGLTPVTTGNLMPFNYHWSGTNGFFGDSTIANPLIIVANSSSYFLKVSNQGGCSDIDTINVTLDTTCFVSMSGTVYEDFDSNCVQGVGEDVMPYILISLDNSVYTFTDTQGNYSFSVDAGTYSIIQYLPTYFKQSCPAGNRQVSLSSYGTFSVGNDFHNQFSDSAYDLRINLFSITTPRPGFFRRTLVSYRNDGVFPLDVIIIYKHDSNLSFQSSTVPHDAYNTSTSTLQWNINNLMPGQAHSIDVYFSVPPGLSLGTAVYDTASISPLTGDWTPANNVSFIIDTVIGAYDPNDKAVSPKGVGEHGRILRQDSLLTYFIQFQNTGTASAQNVIIKDTLDGNLNLSTFHAEQASHNYTLSVEGDSIIVFYFNNIMLPDSNADEPGSHGYVSFSIKIFPNLPYGTEISNRAAIYFDFNPPIITNAVVNTISQFLIDPAVSTIPLEKNDKFQVYPNPSSEVFHVVLPNNDWKFIKMLTSIGQEILRIENTGEVLKSISIANQHPGLYLIMLETEAGTFTKKITVLK